VDHHHFGCITKLTPPPKPKKVNHDVYLFIYLFGLVFGQFCDAAKVAMIHTKI
jgi:hypothetical protein